MKRRSEESTARSVDFSGTKIPLRMRQGGRPIDPVFEPDESLFHCVSNATLQRNAQGCEWFANIRVPDTSCNRSKYDGEWDDVLLIDYPKFAKCGVIWFSVSDIPHEQQREEGESIYCEVCHDPLELNYYHCELRFFRGKEREQLAKVPSSTKSWIRLAISNVLTKERVLKVPEE
jgi:hypothetical protein